MSKREAEEYITKEHGSTPNQSQGDKKKMATAAQLARRKMAVPRSRVAGRATTPTGSTPQSGNPFAPPQQQQTFQPVGGFTFGASQNSQPSDTEMQTSANGFTFSAGQPDSNPFNNIQLNNPFANTNGSISNSFPPANGGFAGSSMNTGKRSSDDMMMESPEKKQAGTHPFGRHQGFIWANPSQSQQQQPAPAPAPSFSFGSSQQNNNQPNGGLFGSVSKPEPAQQNNSFGQLQSSQPSFSGFGQTTQTTPAPPSFSCASKEQTPTPAPSFTTSFGQSTSNQQSEAPKFSFLANANTQASGSPLMFGQTPAAQKTDAPLFGSKDSSRATSPFKLGEASSEPSTSTNPFGSIKAPAPVRQYTFGQTAEDSASDKPEDPKPTPSLFGSSAASTRPPLFSPAAPTQPTPSLFGPASSSSKPTPVFSFGQPAQPKSPTNEEKSAEAPKNPFAHIPNPSASTQPSLPPASTAAENAKPVFSFAGPPQPSASSSETSSSAAPSSNIFGLSKTSKSPTSSLFGSPSKAPGPSDAVEAPRSPEKEQESAPTKSNFSFGSTQPPSSGGLFTPAKPTSTDKAPATEPAKAPLFGGGSPLFQRAPAPAAEPATEKPKKQLSGRTLDGNSTSSQPAAPEPAVKAPLFGAPAAAKSAATETVEKPASFSSAAPPAPKPAAKSLSPATNQSMLAEPSAQRPVYTKSPARIPSFLNGEGYKEYDSNFRLRALNREFQRRMSALDPARHDFENIIRHYVAARASIGADIGLYQRTMAGTKRKNDTIDEQELELPQQYKKIKSNDGLASTPAPPQSVAKTNTFGSTRAPAQAFASSAAPASKATSMFSQMIPKSPGKTSQPPGPKQAEPEKPANIFASIPNPPPAGPSFIRNLVEEIENNSAPKGSGAPTFGNHIPSETPPKSSQGFVPANAPATTPAKPSQGFVPSTTPGGKPPQGFVPASAPPSDLFAAFAAKAAKNEKKRKAEILEDEYSSDEDSQAEGRKKLEEEDRAKRAKYDSIPKTGFTPNIQKSTSPAESPPRSGFISLAQSIEKPVSTSKFSPTKAKRNGPFQESDSDEAGDDKEGEADDEETTEEKDGEFQPEDQESTEESEEDQEDEEDDLPEDEVQEEEEDDDDVNREAEIEANPNKGKSLFDRIEANPDKPNDTPVNGDKNVRKSIESGSNFSKGDDPILGSAKNSSFKPGVWGSHIGKSTPDAPAFSPITPATTSSYKPATTFNFTATPATTTPTPAPGASVLSGGLTAGSYSKFDGMFGSRPTTPNPTDMESPAPATSSGPVNHTWTAGSPIKFGETPEKAAAPKIALTAASPEKDGDTTPKAPAPSPFGSLFGTTPASTFKPGDTNSGFSFGAGKPDFLSAKKPFETASGLTSGISSRGTSPGLTDAESVQTDASDAMPPEPQANLSDSRAGEENQDCLFEAKSKALKFITEEAAKNTKSEPNTWETQGVGMFRLLRDKETGKCRVLFRAEPGGNIIVNANLLEAMEYASIPQGNSGAVKGPLYNDKKKTLERWVFKLKTKDMAAELEALMKEHQKN